MILSNLLAAILVTEILLVLPESVKLKELRCSFDWECDKDEQCHPFLQKCVNNANELLLRRVKRSPRLCVYNEDCFQGSCIEGVCDERRDPDEISCRGPGDCFEGQECLRGHCIEGRHGGRRGGLQCNFDPECPKGQFCSKHGICQGKHNKGFLVGCMTDRDCRDRVNDLDGRGQCIDNICVSANELCYRHHDCPSKRDKCFRSRCIFDKNWQYQCPRNSRCEHDEKCINGYCLYSSGVRSQVSVYLTAFTVVFLFCLSIK